MEGSERNRRFEEDTPLPVLLAAQLDSDSDDERQRAARTRVARSRSVAELEAPAPAARPESLVRYRCPLKGCQAGPFHKVAGLLAHTRMKHKIQKAQVAIPQCRFTVRILPDGTEVEDAPEPAESEPKRARPDSTVASSQGADGKIKFRLTMPKQEPK